MGIDRRQFVGALGAGITFRSTSALATDCEKTAFLSAANVGGAHKAMLLDEAGNVCWSLALPGRGHGGAFRPGHADCVVFARRPGAFALVLDCSSGREKQKLMPPANRHFYGHGCYSADGRRLYTTENDFDGERGVIGIWDAAERYRRIGEFDSYGVGPHEVILMPDGRTLAIANGGILTHPETGRRKLNIPDMAPSIVMLDSRSGQLVTRHEPPRDLHKLSLRHLSANRQGILFAAAQFEGAPDDRPPLLASLHGEGLKFHKAPSPVLHSMRNYCGALSFNAAGNVLAVSCPRGNLITFWTDDGTFISAMDLSDGCGVAAFAPSDDFLATSGEGSLIRCTPQFAMPIVGSSANKIKWDNHVAARAQSPL